MGLNIAGLFDSIREISPDNVREIIKNDEGRDVEIIDVREPAEYERGHLPGAKLIPLSSLPDRIDEIDNSKRVVTYCARGGRSRSAAALLKREGINDAASMSGGMTAWNGISASGTYDAGMFLIDDHRSFEELAALAWLLEGGAKEFYEKAADMTDDQDTADLLSSLVTAEKRHQENIASVYKNLKKRDIDGSLSDDDGARGLMEGGVEVQGALEWLNARDSLEIDLLELSMQMEANSLDLYIKIKREIADKDAVALFDVLIREEKGHLKRLGRMINKKI